MADPAPNKPNRRRGGGMGHLICPELPMCQVLYIQDLIYFLPESSEVF